jgi:hypothetical protein
MVVELGDAARDQLRLVSQAVFENPFGPRRHALDLQIAGTDVAGGREALIDTVVARVRASLSEVAGGPLVDVRRFEGEPRQLVERAVLFVLFHEFAEACDAHIQSQIAKGPRGEPEPEPAPAPAPFAGELFDRLRAHGFTVDAAARYVAIIFQMRRAFIFIDRALSGRALAMVALRTRLWSNVFTDDIARYERWLLGRMEDFSTILLGETGTGKGTAAAAIGRSGYIPFDPGRGRFVDSFTHAFVAVNLAQFPASLLESELFGHKKGAFTGAIDSYDGAFGRCSPHGAIFLDEIGDVGVPVQIKLLRVLQERTFTPVGSHQPRRFSGRVIAATNQDLDEARRSGRFRDDFYYRLCADVLVVPPLRERIAQDAGELEILVAEVVARIVGQPSPSLCTQVLEAIDRDLPADYGWPGNVRELEQSVRRILLTRATTGGPSRTAAGPAAALCAAIETGTLPARELVSRYCQLLYARHGTYEEVARRTGLDRRTVKRHVDAA